MKTLTVIPLATPQTVPQNSLEAVKSVDRLYLQTTEHICANAALRIRPEAVSMDDLYSECFDFDELNERIAERLAAAFESENAENLSVGYAVLGRGVEGELAALLCSRANENGFTVRFMPAPGFAESAVCAAANCGHIAPWSGYDIRSAHSFNIIGTDFPVVIEETDNLLIAGEIKLRLSEYYPDESDVFVCTMNNCGEYDVNCLPLHRMDHPEAEKLYGAATVVLVPPCGLLQRTRHGIDGLLEVMHRLRAPGGCPWDAEQTHESLRSSLLEETYEVLDALDSNDMTALEEELGDLLLQIVFHSVIEEECSDFTLRDVTTGITNKLIYRHPHVFGGVEASNASEVLDVWDQVKLAERQATGGADGSGASEPEGLLDGVPRTFPALMEAQKISRKAAAVGFEWDSIEDVWDKVAEEKAELIEAYAAAPHAANGKIDTSVAGEFGLGEEEAARRAEAAEMEFGDVLFALVNVGRRMGIDAESALRASNAKFRTRWVAMEEIASEQGKRMQDFSTSEQNELWGEVKGR